MYVTSLPWCDFVVCIPVEDPFAQRVYYRKSFLLQHLFAIDCFLFQNISQSSEVTDPLKTLFPLSG